MVAVFVGSVVLQPRILRGFFRAIRGFVLGSGCTCGPVIDVKVVIGIETFGVLVV